MLLNNKIKENDVVTMRSISGEEIVAQVVSQDSDIVMVKKPMTLVDTNGGYGLSQMTFTISEDSVIPIFKHSLMLVTQTEESMAAQYLNSFKKN